MALEPFGARADRINPTVNFDLVTCNYSIIIANRSQVTVRTGRRLGIELAHTCAATDLVSS